MNMESQKLGIQNNIKIKNIQDDIFIIDSISFKDYFNQILNNFDTPDNDCDNNEDDEEESINRDELDIEKYIEFVN